MIPSVSHATSQPRLIPRPAQQLEPLTLRSLIRESYLEPGTQQSIRRMGPYSWFENKQIASQGNRVEFINGLVDTLLQRLPLKDTPITLVSLGAGGLLTERLIDYQLKLAGYQNIQWRVIDVEYQQNTYQDALDAFKEKINSEFLAYSTEQSYLDASANGVSQANQDRMRGATVLLAVDPPTALEQIEFARVGDFKHLLLRGRPIEDCHKANSIYLFVVKDNHKHLLEQAYEGLLGGDKVVISSHALRLTLDENNVCQIMHGLSNDALTLNNAVMPYIDKMQRIAGLLDQKINLQHADKALDKFLAAIAQQGLNGRKFYVSDYDSSISNLNNYLNHGANPCLYASLDQNEITFT